MGRDPLIGSIYENYVVSEFLKNQLNKGTTPDLYFFRDSNGFELDLILERQRVPQPVEIKSAYTYNPDMCKNLRTFTGLVPESQSPTLIYAGKSMGMQRDVNVLSDDSIHSLVE